MTPLEAIDRDVASLEAQLSKLRTAREILADVAGDLPAGPRRPTSAPEVDRPASGPTAAPGARPKSRASGQETCRRIAAAIEAGSHSCRAIAKAIGQAYPSAAKMLKGRPHWFAQGAGGWELTTAGRAELLGGSGDPDPKA